MITIQAGFFRKQKKNKACDRPLHGLSYVAAGICLAGGHQRAAGVWLFCDVYLSLAVASVHHRNRNVCGKKEM